MSVRNTVGRVVTGLAAVGMAATASATLATPAYAGMSGCNNLVCIRIDGSGLNVKSVRASLTSNSRFYGHFHIYGGGLDRNTVTQSWGYPNSYTLPVNRNLPNGSVICVEGWSHVNGGVNSVGRACGQVSF
ncbi:hypothetical protein Q5425_35700 [Amycolatopsis sp. A133]|uniref:hypothetical protein n=1 Tax=Amycolatopsis sp. A133 TaxID=3064472 RepID=UPI0027EB0C5E|nr:hypothetical protein [Amycolatopsis sp. A133]MDQ7809101.1 hypothetical protein [Amycolatopsis sp. A133]